MMQQILGLLAPLLPLLLLLLLLLQVLSSDQQQSQPAAAAVAQMLRVRLAAAAGTALGLLLPQTWQLGQRCGLRERWQHAATCTARSKAGESR
jgi:hypothetical protein